MKDNSQKNFLGRTLGGVFPAKFFLGMGKWAIAFLGLFILLGIWQTGNNFFAGVRNIFRVELKEPEVNISTVIVEKIRGASELTTAIYTTETVVPTHQDRELMGIFQFRTKMLYIAYGEVEAGIDLSQLTVENVTVVDDRIYIQLPPPQILDAKIDVNRSRIYDYDRDMFNLGPDVAPELQTLAQRITLEKIVASACDRGLLEEASDRAKFAIAELLTLTGHQQIEIEVLSPDVTSCHMS